MLNNKLLMALNNNSISKVLNQILDKLDKQSFESRTNDISIFVNEKNFKELYEPKEYGNDENLEKDIYTLVEFNIFSFPKNVKAYLPLVERKTKLIFNKKYENDIRSFYKREKIENTWTKALEDINSLPLELKDFLRTNPIRIIEKNDKDVLERFESWYNLPKISTSLREESARCFWGMSKVFETKEGLNKFLNLNPMPISLQIYAKSEKLNDVLFIENLETFYTCISSTNKIFDNMILIYSSGYKVSARRVRDKIGSRMFFSDDSKFCEKSKQDFISWFYKENDNSLNTYFWGDLDYEGMNILCSLRNNFADIKVWKPAYEKMYDFIKNDFGHTPIMAKKEKQRIVKNKNCKYTNLLNEKELFLDQESINVDLL